MFKASGLRPSRKPGRVAALAAGLLAAFTTTSVMTVTASASPRFMSHALNETPPKGPVIISETGSTPLYPLFQMWSRAYHKQYPNIRFNQSGTGPGAGTSDAAAGVADIGASDAYLSSSQVSADPGLKNIALAISAEQVIYNVPGVNNHNLKLDAPVLSEIYQGQITNWNDSAIQALNPGFTPPDLPIVAFHRRDPSGDTFLFSSYLSTVDPDWEKLVGSGTSVAFPSIPRGAAETGNGGMVTACRRTVGCIAYIGISYLGRAHVAGLGAAMLQNKSANFVLPTAATMTAEAESLEAQTPANETLSMVLDSAPTGYPIVNYEYAIVPASERSRRIAAAVKAFLYWAVDPKSGSASSFLNQVDFQPLPPKIAALSDAQIATISG